MGYMLCRMFTTHEQLAVAQEREADLVAQLHQAHHTAAPQHPLGSGHPEADTDPTAEDAIDGQVCMPVCRKEVSTQSGLSSVFGQLIAAVRT